MIEIKNLCKYYKTKNGIIKAIDNISMDIQEEDFCVLLGTSGSGKTTTLKAINRLIEPTSGNVTINGKDVLSLDPILLRRKIGYVFQRIGLFPNMNVEQNCSIVPHLLKINKQETKQRVKYLLDIFELPNNNAFLLRYPYELSGGQAQRIGVIRALAANPDIVLMDEPFGAVDPISRNIIQDEFLKIKKELKKTVLFVSHDIDEALKMSNKIAIFSKGKIVQFCTTKNLLLNPKNDFIKEFIGTDRLNKILKLTKISTIMQKAFSFNEYIIDEHCNIEQALIFFCKQNVDFITCVNKNKVPTGIIKREDVSSLLSKYGA